MKGNVVKNKISIAPMVDRTDRNFRTFVRMINKDVLGGPIGCIKEEVNERKNN